MDKKSKSSDTLVCSNATSSPSNATSSSGNAFAGILNSNALKIQQWYRKLRQRQLRESISALDLNDIDIEKDTLKRRKMKANLMRQEALKELEETYKTSKLELNDFDESLCSQSVSICEDIALVCDFYTENDYDGENEVEKPENITKAMYRVENGNSAQNDQPISAENEPESFDETHVNDQNHCNTPNMSDTLLHDTDYESQTRNLNADLLIKSMQDFGNPKSTTDGIEISENASPISSHAKPILKTLDSTDHSVSRILSFLKSAEAIQSTEYSQSSIEVSETPIFDNVKQKMLNYQLEITQKSKTISALQQELERLRNSTAMELNQSRESHKSQLELQRKQFEAIIKRHLGFIDKVMGEKEELTIKTVELSEKVTQLQRQFTQKTSDLEANHQRDLSKQKEIWAVSEKTRREKWIQEKTKVIKEQTIQALEPEIQKLLASHKSALALAEENYRNTLATEKNTIAEMHQRTLDQNREKFILERQKACEEEREFARQRYLKQLEREEMEFQQHKRKMQSEFEQERYRQQESAQETIKSLEISHRRQTDQLRSQLDRQAAEFQAKHEQSQRGHSMEIERLKDQFVIEKQEWQQNYMSKTESQQRHRDKIFREQLIKQRDQEIEAVIERLESESGSNNSDAARKYRMDVERIKAETAEEIKELRDQHSMALDKLLSAQKANNDLEAQLRDSQKRELQNQHLLLSKDSVLKRQKIELSRLAADESVLIKDIREEFEKSLDSKHEEIKSLKLHMETEQKSHRESLELLRERIAAIELEKVNTLEQVEKQVRATLATKEQKIGHIEEQLRQEKLKSRQLENLMEQQRNELLGL